MQLNTYQEAVTWLFAQFPSYQQIGAQAYKPDLGNIREICSLIGNPQEKLLFIHVAGTNGKGSTSSMLASVLTESGKRTGLFTSPHIHDFRERIRINGEMIPELDVINFCNRVLESQFAAEPSFFEITLAMAFDHFLKNNCDICVIETGLGGRLDATNIVIPILSIITNIGLEHTQFLGNTLTEIAGEKAGIIKPEIPVVIGEFLPETRPVFEAIAERNHAEIIFSGETPYDGEFRLPFLAAYQKINFRTVYTAIQVLKKRSFPITSEHIQNGLDHLTRNTGFMGRMQVISQSPLTILDVSHNYDGVKATLSSIDEINRGRLHIIYGTSSDKNYKEIISLFPSDCELILCKFNNPRSLSKEQLESLSESLPDKPPVFDHIHDAIRSVQETANKADTILVFGSFFLISDFF